MADIEKAIRILEGSYKNFVLRHNGELITVNELLALLKAQEAVVMAGAELTDAELIEGIRKAPIVLKPNVDAVPVVHGNWIECYERSRHYYCSNCGKVQGIASIVMKYCPECGARMAEHPWAGRYADQSGAEYADNPTV